MSNACSIVVKSPEIDVHEHVALLFVSFRWINRDFCTLLSQQTESYEQVDDLNLLHNTHIKIAS